MELGARIGSPHLSPNPGTYEARGRSKHKHIFVYYQRPDVPNDMNEFVDAKGEPKIMITTGEHEDARAPFVCGCAGPGSSCHCRGLCSPTLSALERGSP